MKPTPTAATDFIFIGGTDAATGGADRTFARGLLPGDVELLMQWQNERGIFGDAQRLRRDDDALLFQLGDFVDERLQIDDDAIADHRELAAANNTGR